MKKPPTNPEIKKYRPKKGYSYGEVCREIDRRVKGECALGEKERQIAHEKALAVVGVQFHLAWLLADFLKTYGIKEKDLLAFCGCEKDDSADTLLAYMHNPYPKHAREQLSINEDVDLVYPGRQVNRSV